MIGLNRPMQAHANPDEPPEVRNLTKSQLYVQLAEVYLLPPPDSRGVNRAYLVGVFTHRHYRLPLLEYKRFAVELTPLQLKKVKLVNLSYTLRKLNALLEEQHAPTLGFAEFTIPEEVWLTKIARFVDRKNVMEFFQASLQPIGQAQFMSERVHGSRTNAHQFVFADNNILENPRVHQSVVEISECYRRIISKRIDIEEMARELQVLRNKLRDEEATQKSALIKSATIIISVAEDNFNPDQLYIEGNENAVNQRLQMVRIQRMLKFIYCTDSVLDRDAETAELAQEYAVRVNQNRA
jgi:hypothetical protein